MSLFFSLRQMSLCWMSFSRVSRRPNSNLIKIFRQQNYETTYWWQTLFWLTTEINFVFWQFFVHFVATIWTLNVMDGVDIMSVMGCVLTITVASPVIFSLHRIVEILYYFQYLFLALQLCRYYLNFECDGWCRHHARDGMYSYNNSSFTGDILA
jgi:hypothetical protein